CVIGMGAKITGACSSRIDLEVVERLSGCEHRIIPDRFAPVTFLVAAAMAGCEVLCKMTAFHSLEPVIDTLRATNALLEVHDDSISHDMRGREHKAVIIKTMPHPAF
ncbi:UDP-N-acetylglucosamine 1-carboxyvinyltransferase, partial [Pseudoalteromonas sp. S1688]